MGQEGLKMMVIPEDAPCSSPTRLKEPANEPLFSDPRLLPFARSSIEVKRMPQSTAESAIRTMG